MDHERFWREELRSFPRGGAGGALWLGRLEGSTADAPLNLLLVWGWGDGSETPPPPLGPLHAVVRAGQRRELARSAAAPRLRKDGVRAATRVLAVEPVIYGHRLRIAGGAEFGNGTIDGDRGVGEGIGSHGIGGAQIGGTQFAGALAVWFADLPPWGEAIRLWLRACAARLGPMLPQLGPPVPAFACGVPRAGGAERTGADALLAPTLFPLPAPSTGVGGRARRRGLPLPRPICVPGLPGAVGASREIARIGHQVTGVAASGVSVLIHGESGTGKEILAHALHAASDRGDGPFIGVNCAALPETLFESELFGHKAGAFTGAGRDKPGLLEAANGGTFFLDEIGDMPRALQIKLLRVMQERSVRRVGELDSRAVDIRFIAATHHDLQSEVDAGRFRLDLYFRLNVVRMTLPPLRQRPEDIAPLLAHFLLRQGREPDDVRITEAALAALQAWRWPGNVRELENEVLRWLALQPGEALLRRRHLSEEIQRADQPTVDPADLGTLRQLDQASELLERYLIRKAIAAAGGRKAAAARRLGLSRQGLYKKLQRYGMSDLVGPSTRT